ncbi:MAG TPA: hypothetical protein VK283_07485 [Acidimicrobiales bacterium]|nr:hypothetical protein [Acidimicrobiales bacterium]
MSTVGGPGFCPACGRPPDQCGGCGRELDPPRFCTKCGRRMAVTVTPTGYVARCRDHGVEGAG